MRVETPRPEVSRRADPAEALTSLSHGAVEGGFEGGSDAIGEVGEHAFGSHAEGSRDQFRVEVVDHMSPDRHEGSGLANDAGHARN